MHTAFCWFVLIKKESKKTVKHFPGCAVRKDRRRGKSIQKRVKYIRKQEQAQERLSDPGQEPAPPRGLLSDTQVSGREKGRGSPALFLLENSAARSLVHVVHTRGWSLRGFVGVEHRVGGMGCTAPVPALLEVSGSGPRVPLWGA